MTLVFYNWLTRNIYVSIAIQSTLALWTPRNNRRPDNRDSFFLIPGKIYYRYLTEINSHYYGLLLMKTLT